MPLPDQSVAAAAGAANQPLSEAVRVVTGGGADKSIGARISGLRAAGTTLTQVEQDELLAFLERSGPVEGLSVESARWLKNDIMNLLTEQEKPSPRLVETMIRVFRNPNEDAVLRDYAVQHLGIWDLREGDLMRRAEIERTLWEAAGERDGTIGGTALIALGRAAQSNTLDSAGAERLGSVALGMARDPGASLAARVTALQLCARQEVGDVLPLARELAGQQGDTTLRISAMAVIGQLGGTNDLPLLQEMKQGGEPRMIPAADGAIRRILARRPLAGNAAAKPPAPR